MKKVLFASTALLATASMASAEIKFSGFGRFGIGYLEDRTVSTTTNTVTITAPTTGGAITTVTVQQQGTASSDDTILVSRFRLNIDAITETDGGVEFSARVRLQADENDGNGEAEQAELSGARFTVAYGGLRVDAGNVSGAFDNLANRAGNEPGLEEFIGQGAGIDYDFLAFSSTGAGDNAVFFQYAVGDFAFGASYDQVTVFGPGGSSDDNDRWDVSLTYTFGNITAAVAYGETDGGSGGSDQDLALLTLGGEWGDFGATLLVGTESDTAPLANGDETDGTVWGLSFAYNLGAATTLQAAYGDGSEDGDTQQYGVGAIYDLGGGASLRGGIGNIKVGDADSQIRADFGAQFDF